MVKHPRVLLNTLSISTLPTKAEKKIQRPITKKNRHEVYPHYIITNNNGNVSYDIHTASEVLPYSQVVCPANIYNLQPETWQEEASRTFIT